MSALVSTLDIELYRGITFRLNFEAKEIDAGGTVIGPLDLSAYDKLVLFLRDVLPADLELASDEAPNAEGSYIQIDNAATGEFSMKFSADTLASVNKRNGDWRIEAWTGEDNDLFVHGKATVQSYAAGGEI